MDSWVICRAGFLSLPCQDFRLDVRSIKMEKPGLLKEIFGEYKKSGNEYIFFCPNCNHHKKKLSINIDKNCFKCWICNLKRF